MDADSADERRWAPALGERRIATSRDVRGNDLGTPTRPEVFTRRKEIDSELGVLDALGVNLRASAKSASICVQLLFLDGSRCQEEMNND